MRMQEMEEVTVKGTGYIDPYTGRYTGENEEDTFRAYVLPNKLYSSDSNTFEVVSESLKVLVPPEKELTVDDIMIIRGEEYFVKTVGFNYEKARKPVFRIRPLYREIIVSKQETGGGDG